MARSYGNLIHNPRAWSGKAAQLHPLAGRPNISAGLTALSFDLQSEKTNSAA